MAVREASSIGAETANGKRGHYQRRSQQTMMGTLSRDLATRAQNKRRITWPSPKADKDPEWFFRNILGVELWDKQREAVLATVGHKRVAVSSGHKTGKSYFVAGLALSKYCAYSDSRVVFTSTTSRQVDDILWRQTRQLIAESGRCVDCKRDNPQGPKPCPHSALIDGVAGDLARTGLKSGFREIKGFTAKEPEAVAGISGAHLWYFPDEASGIPEEIFQAIEGNRAGGARIVLTSNPTRTEGTFFDAFHSKKDTWHTITISSADTPNCTIAPGTIPGLADPEWIAEKAAEWGTDSAFYKVRVLGKFPLNEDGKIFSLATITESQERWKDTPTPEPGQPGARLYIGVDPAGAAGQNDEAAFCARRGSKMISIHTRRALSEEGHLVEILALCNKLKGPGEVPVVVLDREGKVGAATYGYLNAYQSARPKDFLLAPVRVSELPVREPHVYSRQRDELAANAERWMKEGGAILDDPKFEQELHSLMWVTAINGKSKVTDKRDLRRVLGRSPDRYDAFALSVWEPKIVENEEDAASEAEKPADRAKQIDRESDLTERGGALDPWTGLSAWD